MAEQETDQTGGERAALAARAAHFSFVRGGPVDRLERALGGSIFGRRAAIVLALGTWVPLAVLAMAQAWMSGTPLRESFAVDFAAHARYLVAIPLFVLAARFFDEHAAHAVMGLVQSGMIRPGDYREFAALLDRAQRACSSRVTAAAPMLVAYIWSVSVVLGRSATAVAPWVGGAHGAGYTAAGYWQLLVSLPAFLYLAVGWMWRWIVWCWVLYRLSRLRLRLIATHPDGAAGLKVLASPLAGYALYVTAFSALLSAAWSRLVLFDHVGIRAFQTPLLVFALVVIATALLPLMVFAAQLHEARERDEVRYSVLANEYMQYYDVRFLGRGAPYDTDVLGHLPAQDMGSVGASLDYARHTRLVPFGKEELLRLVVAVLIPMVPLGLTTVPMVEVARRLLHAVL